MNIFHQIIKNMKSIFKNPVEKKLIGLSSLIGIIISWLIKEGITPLVLGGKTFAHRSLLTQIFIMVLLIIFVSVSLFLFLKSFYLRNEKFKDWLDYIKVKSLAIITFTVAGFAAWVTVKFSGQPLLEIHSFRQTQTALTAYWIIREGWQLAYQTPVAGYPWSIPFEFPFYQLIVAFISRVGNLDLVPVGRIISFCFLIACAWPAFKITRKLDLPTDVAWVFCALLWSSPIYLFWGRTFMIETAAVFFTFMAIPYAFDICKPSPKWKSVILFSFWATLGMLQKVTTAAPVVMVMAIICLVDYIKTTGIRIPSWRKIACVAIAFVIPVLIGFLWVRYTDLIKEQNFFGQYNTSKALTGWNFGTIQQRLDLSFYRQVFWQRVILRNAAGVFGISLIAVALIWGERRIKLIVATCLCLFVLPVLIFTNLHIVHTYYQVSCALFLIGALAVSVVILLPRLSGKYFITPILTIILVTSNFFFFSKGYANKIQQTYDIYSTETLAVGDVINRYTPEDSGIVVFGLGWTSRIAFYSERKSFSVQQATNEYDVYEAVWNEPSAFLGNKELGAIVFCVHSNNTLSLAKILENPEVKKQPRLFKVRNCYIWMPDVEEIFQPGIDRTILPVDITDS